MYNSYPFRSDEIHVSENGWARCLSVAFRAKVEKVIAILDDGHITEDINSPQTDVWFLMDCMSTTGSSFSVAYNGEDRWIPVRRAPELKVATDLRPRPNINLDQICVRDKVLFDAAVQIFKVPD